MLATMDKAARTSWSPRRNAPGPLKLRASAAESLVISEATWWTSSRPAFARRTMPDC